MKHPQIPHSVVEISTILLLMALVIFGLHGAYLVIGTKIFEHGSQDPIYLITGLSRSTQLKITLWPLLLTVITKAVIFSINKFDRPNFSINRVSIAILFLLLSLNFLIASLPAIFAELNSQYWIRLFVFIAFIIGIQLAFVYVSLSWIKNTLAILSMLVLFSVLNAYAVYIVLLESFLTQSAFLKISIMAVLAISFTLLYAAAGQQQDQAKRINLLLALAIVSSLFFMYLQKEENISEAAMIMEPFKNIKLEAKPDIHILAFDSLIPPILADKFLGLTSVPYESVLDKDGVIVFKNAFASSVPTTKSLNSIMRLARPDFNNSSKDNYFNGQVNSPITEIFSSNGYDISTGSESTFLGMGGDYVNNFYPTPDAMIGHSTLCVHATEKSKLLFYGFCAAASLVEDPIRPDDWSKILAKIILQTGNNSIPDLTFHYLPIPKHTRQDFSSFDQGLLAEYAVQYASKSEVVRSYLGELIEIIKNKKDDSILLILGDHGAWVSRTATFEENTKFYVQDRHGILMAVLINDSKCNAQDFNHYNINEFSTPERVLAGLIRCLSSDSKRMDRAVNFQENVDLRKNFDLSKYLYE